MKRFLEGKEAPNLHGPFDHGLPPILVQSFGRMNIAVKHLSWLSRPRTVERKKGEKREAADVINPLRSDTFFIF